MSQARWTGKRTDMLPEIAAAVGFLSSLLRTRGCVSEQRLKVFSGALQEALTGEHPPRILASVEPRRWRWAPLPAWAVFRLLLGQGSPREQLRDSVSLQPQGGPHPPIPLGRVSPAQPRARVSVRDGSGRARASTLSRTQTLVLECEPRRRLLSGERRRLRARVRAHSPYRDSGGAGGEAARPANGSSWGKKAQLSLLNNLDP
ncbi:PREDICTED: protein BTG2 isoform 1 [Odobenus rosmarus divergens]|uniref:Protein BTG2 isoform 1 n=1 Tax=Odobenus rosmarus divergens TaxID=9708 RepID=A0A9B0G4S8_ODORO